MGMCVLKKLRSKILANLFSYRVKSTFMQMLSYLLCNGTLAMMSGSGQKVTLMLNGLEQGHFLVFFLLIHSVLEQIYIKGSYLDQRLSQHERLYPIGLKSARIEISHIESHYINFSKTDFY